MELAPDVEAALSARFATPIRLVLVVEGDGSGPMVAPHPFVTRRGKWSDKP